MPRTNKSVLDTQILTAGLEGLELRLQRIDKQIDYVRGLLGQLRGRPPGQVVARKAVGRRRMSAAARRRIALAQKRRWAEYRKRKAAKGR